MQFTTIFAATALFAAASAASVPLGAPIEARNVQVISHSKRAVNLALEITKMEKRGQSAACTICTFGCGTGGDLEACDCCEAGGACRDDGSCNL